MKKKWAADIIKKHRDVRVRIVMRRELGRTPMAIEQTLAINNRQNNYKNLEIHEVIKAYEDGDEVGSRMCIDCLPAISFRYSLYSKCSSGA